ncbi:MAG: RsiV family protein [Lachnospiraceae bacterium]|nr:RsiV family protein [Lachnospiraceae bacterium]
MKNKAIGKMFMAVILSASFLAGCAGSSGTAGNSADVEEEETAAEAEAGEAGATDSSSGDDVNRSGQHNDNDSLDNENGDLQPGGIDSEYRQLRFYARQMSNYVYDAELDMIAVKAEATHIELLDEDLPQLKAVIDEYSKNKEDIVYGETFEELKKEAIEYIPDMGDYSEGFSIKYDTTIMRADTAVTCLLTYYGDYTGGVHGNYCYYPVNYDSSTGEELFISDVVDEGMLDEIPDLVAAALLERYGKDSFYGDADTQDAIAETIKKNYGKGDNYSFAVGYEGLTFYFQPYELGPYSSGALNATLKYEDYPELVDEKYTECAADYFIGIDADLETLPHSEDTCNAYLSAPDEWGTYDELVINFNGKDFREEIYGYGADMWICTIGGINYLFVNLSEDNDYEHLMVYSLNSATGNVECCADVYGGFMGYVPADPYEFRIYDRGDVLSTYSMYKNYYVGRDGVPAGLEDFYYIDSDLSLKTISDVEGEVRDDFEGTGTKAVIKSGEKLDFYATDGETWVDFKRKDGSFVRFEVDRSDYPQKVNGTDADAIFDGMMFAG